MGKLMGERERERGTESRSILPSPYRSPQTDRTVSPRETGFSWRLVWGEGTIFEKR